jgi:RNA polymerase sigma-70 factor (ECF subfamily)
MATDESALIHRAQQGDMAAFEQLVFLYDKQVLSLVARYVTSAEDAKDIYQEVFIRVYRGLRKFQERSEFATWLFRITTNVCLTHRARKKRTTHISLDDDPEGSGSDGHPRNHATSIDALPDQQTLSAEIADHVQRALESLSPKQKLVFTLRHYQGYKLKEIASMLECAEGTVKRYLFLATQQMREQLQELYE